MANYIVEFKVKTPTGFTHARQTVEASQISNAINEAASAGDGEFGGLEFITVRLVKQKPVPVKVEAKK